MADDLAYGIMTLRTQAERIRAKEELRRAGALCLIHAYLPGLAYIKDEEGRFFT